MRSRLIRVRRAKRTFYVFYTNPKRYIDYRVDNRDAFSFRVVIKKITIDIEKAATEAHRRSLLRRGRYF